MSARQPVQAVAALTVGEDARVTEPAADGRLHSLTALRWWAALLVFCYHFTQNGRGPEWRPLKVFAGGQTGVLFFFILSGFVLTWSARPGLRATGFYRRRFARVYPSHAVVLIATLLLGLAVPTILTAPETPGRFLLVAALLQAWSTDPSWSFAFHGVSWSLSCELFFYATFPLVWLALDRTRRPLLWAGCASALAAAVGSALVHLSARFNHVAFVDPLLRLPDFTLGVALALVVQRGWRSRVPLSAAVCLVGVGLVGATQLHLSAPKDYLLVVPFALLILTAALTDVDGRPWSLLRHRLSVYLGEVSFAFYLVHQQLTRLLVQELDWRGPQPPAVIFLAFVVCLGVSLVTAMALHHAVELPAQRWLSGARVRTGSQAA